MLELYRRCPRCFAQHYLAGAPAPAPTVPRVVGATLHAALADLLRVPDDRRSLALGERLLRER